MSSKMQLLSALHGHLRQRRRQMAESSPKAFAQIYLSAHCAAPFSRMHDELFRDLEKATCTRSRHLAIAAPRGHAKSTIASLAYVLWCMLYAHEQFILLVSATREQADQLLKHVRDEVRSNPLLIQDFPEFCYPPGTRPAIVPWQTNKIVLNNDVMVRSLGAGQGVRGLRHRQHRPGLIIVDDLESQVCVDSAEQREKLKDWFEKTLLKAGDPQCNVIIVGTIMHFDSLLGTLIDPRKSPGWIGRKYQAVLTWSPRADLWHRWECIYHHSAEHEGLSGPEAARRYFDQHTVEMLEGTHVLWPQREDYYALMELRAREGDASFDSEKQNEPVDPANCLFPSEEFHFWDDQFKTEDELFASIGTKPKFYGACDPSLGKPGKNRDDSAIITLAKNPHTGVLYVIDADICRRTPDQIIDTVIDYQRRRGYVNFVFECNQFQAYVAEELTRRSRRLSVHIPLHPIDNRGDKMGRIQKLQPLVKNGTIRFSRRHRTLLDQLRQFPKAAHDDGPDALEMAIRASKRPKMALRFLEFDEFGRWRIVDD